MVRRASRRCSTSAGTADPVAALPADLLQRAFSIKEAGAESHPLITLQHRLRCQLVSRAWRAALGPRSRPVRFLWIDTAEQTLVFPGMEETTEAGKRRALALAEWVCRVRPAAEEAGLWLGPIQPLTRLVRAAHDALLALQPRKGGERAALLPAAGLACAADAARSAPCGLKPLLTNHCTNEAGGRRRWRS